MTTIQFRRVVLGAALALGIVAYGVAPALAADPTQNEPPAANPKCGSGAGLMNHMLTARPSPTATTGRNLVSIQRVSPINGTPGDSANNGFIKICKKLGFPGPPLGGTTDLNGDAVQDDVNLRQFDAFDGAVLEHNCSNANSGGIQWDEGQGAELRITLGGGASGGPFGLVIPGVECSQKFAVYRSPSISNTAGKLYFPIPLSTIAVNRGEICDQLNLPNGSQIQMVDAANGVLEDYFCNTPRDLDGFRTPLPTGEAALILGGDPLAGIPDAALGRPVNCFTPGAAPAPCPATPNDDYPAPLIF